MTVCVLRAAGGQTALCPVTVKTVRLAHLMKVHASVHLDSEEPPANTSVLRVSLATAVARHVHTVSTAMAPVTM